MPGEPDLIMGLTVKELVEDLSEFILRKKALLRYQSSLTSG